MRLSQIRAGSSIRSSRVTAGTSTPEPPSEEWSARSDVPAGVNPAGTLWKVEREWTFDGAEGAAPPVPWHTGTEWAGPHANLGGHVWRNQVNLDSMAYLDGAGALVLKLDWNATYSTAVGAYLITDQDGSAARPDDYRVDPTAEDGVYIEFEVSLPETQAQASWAACWTYATEDDTPLHSSLAGRDNLREEIDMFEKIGNARPYYQQRFHTNTWGRQPGLLSDCAEDEGLPVGQGFAPVTGWSGAAPNDGNPHKWAMMWVPDPDGAQSFFYDGHEYATRPKPGDTVHLKPHGLRMTWETEFWADAGSPTGYGNTFGASVVPPADETAYFPREMKVYNVRVLRRRLPASPPGPGSKPTDSAVLQAKGLSLIWQDRLGESDAPTDDRQFFQTTTGNRVSEDPTSGSGYSFPSESNRRLSFVTYDSKPCLRAHYPAGAHGWLNYRAQYLPQTYREMGLCVDFIYPAGYNLQNTSGGNTSGKSLFGLLCGHEDHQKPGLPSYPRAWTGAVQWPEDQWGAELGINWTYRASTGNVEYDWYPHVIGAYVNGADRFRLDRFSNLFNIPGYAAPAKQPHAPGVWRRLELYGKMDTNRRDGVLEMWIDGVLRARCANLDLGGWVGNRGLAARTTGNGTNGDGSLSAGTGQLCGANGGGWRFQGIFIREMIGGSTQLQTLVPQYGGSYYAYNFRVYGKA